MSSIPSTLVDLEAPRTVGWMRRSRQNPNEPPRHGSPPEACTLHLIVAFCRLGAPNLPRSPHGTPTRHDREPTCDQHVLRS